MTAKAALSLKKRPVHLGKPNLRPEFHGDTSVGACDVPLKNVMLQAEEIDILLGDGTWNRLFKKTKNSGMNDYPEIADFVATSKLPFSFDGEFENSKITLHMGIDNEDKIEIGKCTIASIKYEPLSGGLVRVSLQAQGNPDPDQVAKMYKHMDHDIDAAVRLGKVKEDEDDGQDKLPLKDSEAKESTDE